MKEHIWAFGLTSAILSLISGILIFLIASIPWAFPIQPFIKFFALTWIVFAIVFLAGVLLFEKHRKKQAALVFLISGFVGLIFAVGFFIGAGIAIFTGFLAWKDHLKDIRIKHVLAKMTTSPHFPLRTKPLRKKR